MERGLVYVIKQLELALRPRFMGMTAEAGMTAAQYTALTVLRRRPGITSSELARRSFVRAQTMAATIDPLRDAGYVRREADPEHGRRILLFLTEKGEDVIDALSTDMRDLEELLVADLTEEERDQFAHLLRRARHSVEQAGHRDAPAAEGAGSADPAR